jgi:hypothetical protein
MEVGEILGKDGKKGHAPALKQASPEADNVAVRSSGGMMLPNWLAPAPASTKEPRGRGSQQQAGGKRCGSTGGSSKAERPPKAAKCAPNSSADSMILDLASPSSAAGGGMNSAASVTSAASGAGSSVGQGGSGQGAFDLIALLMGQQDIRTLNGVRT